MTTRKKDLDAEQDAKQARADLKYAARSRVIDYLETFIEEMVGANRCATTTIGTSQKLVDAIEGLIVLTVDEWEKS